MASLAPTTLTAEQHLIRQTGITGSEIAAVAGLSPWLSPIDVYRRKVGDTGDDVQGHHIERGVFLEQGLLRWYAHRTGHIVSQPGTLVHPEHPLVIATPDAIATAPDSGSARAVEIKSPGWRTASDWGEPGTDQIPSYYVPQIQWELAVCGLAMADVVACVDGDLKIYHVKFHLELFATLRDAAEIFWRQHIAPRIPPPPDGSQAYADWLRSRFELNSSPQLLPYEPTPVLQAYHVHRQLAAMHDKQAERCKQYLITEIAEHGGLEGAWGRIYYRNQHTRPRTDWKAVATALGATPALIAQHTATPQPTRAFRPYIQDIPHDAASSALSTTREAAPRLPRDALGEHRPGHPGDHAPGADPPAGGEGGSDGGGQVGVAASAM